MPLGAHLVAQLFKIAVTRSGKELGTRAERRSGSELSNELQRASRSVLRDA